MTLMRPLPNQYDPKQREGFWQQEWEVQKIYAWDENESRENSFVIDTPPPTVSGLLHMGHIFSYTQADFIARFQRMQGKSVFYPMGFDDNGLPTERLVEKVKNVRGTQMPRQEFVALCQQVVKEAEEEFRTLFKAVALSVDWSQEYQTISPQSRAMSQLSFLDLAHKGEAYRHLQPTLWDPIDRTALAQADIEDKELPSTMSDICFLTEGGEKVTIATTRPELLGACVAVLFHPEDTRYQHLKDKKAITPLFNVEVPLIADQKVDPEKGSGLVMCCTFGDMTDISWWKEHQLPVRMILDKAGRISFTGQQWIAKDNPVLPQLEGLKVKEARAKTLELLNESGLLLKQVEIVHAVKCAERSGAPLEILITPQWFIHLLKHKEALIEKATECQWYPHFMRARVEHWIQGLSWDWCISRQRFFGVPFPVWYSKRPGEEGKIIFARPQDLPVDPLVDIPFGYEAHEVEPDPDVMDTWATSSISPQLSSWGIAPGFMRDEIRHKKLFPADLRPQAHEIIRSWAFYTLVKAHLHENTIPWKSLMISGWCLAADKTKMSKSKGNVITPVGLLQEKGTDVVRYWASTSRLGVDTAYSEDVLKVGKKLVNKLWNAAKFAAIHLEKLNDLPKEATQEVKKGVITENIDLWILSRLHHTIEKATQEFNSYEYCNARVAIEQFFWNDFCDNYLEIVKVRAYDEQKQYPAKQKSAIHTIYHCLDGIIRLFAPFLPHITEELYAHIFAHRQHSVHARGSWPECSAYPKDVQAEKAGQYCVDVLNVVRKVKAEHNVSIKTPISLLTIIPDQEESQPIESLLNSIGEDIKSVTNSLSLTFASKILPDAIPIEGGWGHIAMVLEKSAVA